MMLPAKTAPGFDDPLGLLTACHERITERLDLLERLPGHVLANGADAGARSAAQRILQYFDRAAPHHHEDEEQDLFPMLRAAQHREGADPRLSAWLDRLSAEHRELERGWKDLRPGLVALAQEELGEVLPDLACPDLIDAYRRHIALENDHLLPVAERLLTAREIGRLAAAMQSRRGIKTLSG
jgi:hemerythrin-like domain-containing protein